MSYFLEFLSWIVNSHTLEFLSQTQGKSLSTFWRHFSHWLDLSLSGRDYLNKVIKQQLRLNHLSGILALDACYFGKLCLVTYIDYGTRLPLLYRLSKGEYTDEIKSDLNTLIWAGYPLSTVVSDGKLTITKAIKQLNLNSQTHIKQQLCLAHIQRTCHIYLTKKPQTQAGKELKTLVGKLCLITDPDLKTNWLEELRRIQIRHLDFIQEKTTRIIQVVQPDGKVTHRVKWWYTHKYLRRAYIHLTRHLDKLFVYLDDPKVPKTNNLSEGLFSVLKLWIKRHRGLKRERLFAFIFYLLSYRFYKKQGFDHKTIGMKIFRLIY